MTLKRIVYAVLVSYVGIGIMVGVSIWYTNYTRDENNKQWEITVRNNNRQWCDLMTTLDSAYSDPNATPTTELGKRVAIAISKLRDTFEC